MSEYKYIVSSIIGRDGKARTEYPHNKIIGKTVTTYNLKEGEVAILPFVDDEDDGYARTSIVTGIHVYGSDLIIRTKNSNYKLNKIGRL